MTQTMDEYMRSLHKGGEMVPDDWSGMSEAVACELVELDGDLWTLTDLGRGYIEVMSESIGWEVMDLRERIDALTIPGADRLRRKLDRFEADLINRRDRALRRHFDS